MAKKVQKKKKSSAKPVTTPQPKDFLDMTAPSVVKFNTDHAIVGGVYRSFLALRGYPATTESLALLRHLGEKSGVNLTIYTRQVTAAEEKQIINNASNKNRMALRYRYLNCIVPPFWNECNCTVNISFCCGNFSGLCW